jgi:simple sugar transport system ATP-binding protein
MTEPRTEAVPVLSVRGLSMTFGATQALTDVDLDLHPGEVLGLVGTNGAGKSTLIKIMSGVHRPTAGTIHLDGAPVTLPTPLAASRAGVQTVHQQIDQGIVRGMSAAENLVLDAYADGTIPRLISRRLVRERAAAIARAMDLQVDLDAPVEWLSPSDRQQIIIARALARGPRVLILDEPTSTLSAHEAVRLYDAVRRLSGHGVAVVYISHNLGEIERLCDRVTVLRDGRVRGEFRSPVARTELVAAMLGELVALAAWTAPGDRPTADEVLAVRGVPALPGGPAVDLSVSRGEVVGLTGLIGAGKTELLEQVFGARRLAGGELRLLGRPFRPSCPADAVRAGVALVPEDRATLALIPDWNVTRNITLPFLRAYGRGGLMRRAAERAVASRFVDEMAIRCAGPDAGIASLSGGNQQKVVVARWLQSSSQLLLLDEPFRGIDIGSRHVIVQHLRAQRDRAVLVASSDPEEILEVADRIVVMAAGAIVGEMATAEATTARLASLMAREAAA